MKYNYKLIVLIIIIVSFIGTVSAGIYGDIISLSTDKESYHSGENINIASTVQANVYLSSGSYLRYTITDSNGYTIDNEYFTIYNSLDAGETYSHSWSFSDDLDPGDYNVRLNWYRYGTLIDSRTTSFTILNNGLITELTALGSPYSEVGPIQFRCVTTNYGASRIRSSYCNLTIRYGPNNEFVQSVRYRVPRLNGGQSSTYLWNISNVDFPYNSFQTGGSYIITATWDYSGGSDTRSTSFYSVPTPWIIVALSGLLIGLGSIYLTNRYKNL